ncbi:zinc-ribbon domain-containing protein [Pararhodobacter zhoushanensis]|uniref:zinc-ribbon domain-containing protein n=1 Tax=Pararhodobacter zhoushanensis TaxID=2479545 RepID=UPI000F8EA713|nr:zinc-ribbon domain-containing protein [Pararhodobacter zhoushanensis]
MRLTCPNCNAQYEVDESVIPKAGRDVQCSACGNTWFQYPMEVALQMRAAEMEEDDDEDGPDDEDNARPVGSTMGERAAPRIDKTVLDVLREEADREMGERKRAQGAIETQGDLGLTRPTRSKAAPSRVFGEDDPAPATTVAPAGEEGPVEEENISRRNLLPDIEELTSTLEPGSDRRNADTASDSGVSSERRSFRQGVSLISLLAIALVVVYLLAPLIATTVPALRDPLASYVGAIDSARIAVATMMRGLFGG